MTRKDELLFLIKERTKQKESQVWIKKVNNIRIWHTWKYLNKPTVFERTQFYPLTYWDINNKVKHLKDEISFLTEHKEVIAEQEQTLQELINRQNIITEKKAALKRKENEKNRVKSDDEIYDETIAKTIEEMGL